jgi:hypothetical protein
LVSPISVVECRETRVANRAANRVGPSCGVSQEEVIADVVLLMEWELCAFWSEVGIVRLVVLLEGGAMLLVDEP